MQLHVISLKLIDLKLDVVDSLNSFGFSIKGRRSAFRGNSPERERLVSRFDVFARLRRCGVVTRMDAAPKRKIVLMI